MRKIVQKIIVWTYITTYFRHVYRPQAQSVASANMLILSHRNGAVDGFVYHYALRKGIFLLAKQLQRNPFLKCIFPGISVYRAKDRADASSSNGLAIRECLEVLKKQDEPLCVFPEGTSALGPQHLPLHNGYAKMASLSTKSGGKTTLLPVAIVYDDPTHLGGSVWVVPGEDVVVTQETDVDDIHKKTLENFEKVVFSYPSEESQLLAHQAAVIASLGKKANYYESLRKITGEEERLAQVYHQRINCNAFKYKQTVIYPQSLLVSLWTFIITLPIVVPSLMINIIPIVVGYLAGRTRRHDPNTISLWRSLAGYPTAMLFYLILMCLCPLKAVFILLLSLWGFHLYGAFKKHLCALLNFAFYRSGYAYFKETQNAILSRF